MKLALIFGRIAACFVVSVVTSMSSQPAAAGDNWVWLDGPAVKNDLGTYPAGHSQTGYPAARGYATTWTGINGDFWMFGGMRRSANGFSTYMNDLWKYSQATKQWTWVSGAPGTDVATVYPQQTSQVGTPGSRYSATGWRDAAGNLWLFGGYGHGESNYGLLNDLWKYDIAANTWTYINGSTTVNDGSTTSGLGAAGYPGARYGAAGFKANDGSFYLFGGYAPGNPSPRYSDMWKFSPTDPQNTWTWVAGSSGYNALSVYPAPFTAGTPGARGNPAFVTDFGGNFWMFGGTGYGRTGITVLADLWRFDIFSNTWYWHGGETGAGSYPATHFQTGTPGNRMHAGAWATNGSMWIFGGYGPVPGYGNLNDLWRMTISNSQWTFMDGSPTAGAEGYFPAGYNQQGQLEGRSAPATWTSLDGLTMYLFGGQYANTNFSNDFWSHRVHVPAGVDDWTLME